MAQREKYLFTTYYLLVVGMLVVLYLYPEVYRETQLFFGYSSGLLVIAMFWIFVYAPEIGRGRLAPIGRLKKSHVYEVIWKNDNVLLVSEVQNPDTVICLEKTATACFEDNFASGNKFIYVGVRNGIYDMKFLS